MLNNKNKLAAAFAACALLAGCGGGGDGGDGGGGASSATTGAAAPTPAPVPAPAPAPAPVASNLPVSITLTSPSSVSTEAFEGDFIPSVSISGRLNGDVSFLNGRTLYLFAVVPDPLFGAKPQVSINSQARSGTIQLSGSVAPMGAKVYSNSITIQACLDVNCVNPVSVTNPQVPYSIRVKKGLVLAQTSVQLKTAFGSLPPPVTIPVSLPDNLESWSVSPPPAPAGSQVVRLDKSTGAEPAVVVSPVLLTRTINTVKTTLTVTAKTTTGATFTRNIEVTYSTDSAPATPFAFERPPGTPIVVKQGSQLRTEPLAAGIIFQLLISDRLNYTGTTYTGPAQAAAHPLLEKWLIASMPQQGQPFPKPTSKFDIDIAAQPCSAGACLPPGRYTATMHFTLSPDNTPPISIDYPVIMDVLP
jgi:hypothetical protein